MPKNDHLSPLGERLKLNPRRWVITGVAGFIGSHLAQRLLALNQQVVGLDNLSSGTAENLQAIQADLTLDQRARFQFVKRDIRSFEDLRPFFEEGDLVLHQAAVASVVMSDKYPDETMATNIIGSLNVFRAAAEARAARVVYASSAAVYGNPARLPLGEQEALRPISIYGLTKKVNEETAGLFASSMSTVGLRYFNVYGRRQSPDSAYAGVITAFLRRLQSGKPPVIYGDGKRTRDFVHVSDVVNANLLAATAVIERRASAFNVATGAATSILALVEAMSAGLISHGRIRTPLPPVFEAEKSGDILHSLGSTALTEEVLKFKATQSLREGIADLLN